MFYDVVSHRNTVNCYLLEDNLNTFQLKLKRAERTIINENKRDTFNFCAQDTLFVDFTMIYYFNDKFFEKTVPSWDKKSFNYYLSFIQGKRKTKITDDRVKELQRDVFPCYTSKYGEANFIRDENNMYQYAGHCKFILFDNNIDFCNYLYFVPGFLNEYDNKFNSKEQKFTFNTPEIHTGYSFVNPCNTDLKDVDHFDYLEFDAEHGLNKVIYHYYFNFKDYVNDYKFDQDFRNHKYTRVIDFDVMPELRNMYNKVLNNMNDHVYELYFKKIADIKFQ